MTDPDRPLPPFRRWLILKGLVAALAVFVTLDGAIGLLGPTSTLKITVGILVLIFWARQAYPEYQRYRDER
ncbi:hypothetical protein ACIB24_07770 [Spongisporangium articulatum]|uniref:Uncharacterized protein n=1 Tax=Spongisporangium articulatum TaxID=3362603 RepID=A0ABW8ALV6_9ACTN